MSNLAGDAGLDLRKGDRRTVRFILRVNERINTFVFEARLARHFLLGRAPRWRVDLSAHRRHGVMVRGAWLRHAHLTVEEVNDLVLFGGYAEHALLARLGLAWGFLFH